MWNGVRMHTFDVCDPAPRVSNQTVILSITV